MCEYILFLLTHFSLCLFNETLFFLYLKRSHIQMLFALLFSHHASIQAITDSNSKLVFCVQGETEACEQVGLVLI